MLVGGETAQFEDLGVETLSKLPLVMAIVLTLSFLYLMLIFRSVLIPAKAVLMNLMATFAAFGLTTWVFADGHLEGLFGFTSVGFVQTFLPIMVFALLFGLSMDYEVFLVGRMQECWLLTHDNDEAVVTGVAHTARDDHRGRRHHGRGVRLLPRRRRAGAQGVRFRAGGGGGPGRHAHPAAPGPGDHEGGGR